MKKCIFLALLPVLFLLQSQAQGQTKYRVIIQSPFQPAGELSLDYPEELKREGEAARFLLSIHINKHGSVFSAYLWKSHYPELDKWITKEVRRWKFKPFLNKGKPIPAQGFAKIIFYPERNFNRLNMKKSANLRSINASQNFPEGKLKTVLDKCADYCQTLSAYALYYVCLEKIDEAFRKIDDEFIGNLSFSGGPNLRSNEYRVSPLYRLMIKGLEKHSYAFDYQLIRKDGKINEKRILLEKTGGLIDRKMDSSGSKLSYHLQPVLIPVHFLSLEQRPFFSYQMTSTEKVSGKKAHVIEISPKLNRPDEFQRCKVWVDENDYQILKIEVESSYAEGFKEVYEECSKYFLTPHFIFTHHYEVEKNGILFPSRSEVRIDYFGLLTSKRELKSKANITYSSYRFFTVDVDYDIIKNISSKCKNQISILERFLFFLWCFPCQDIF